MNFTLSKFYLLSNFTWHCLLPIEFVSTNCSSSFSSFLYTHTLVMRRITVLYPYHPGGVGSNAIFLRRQPEAIGGAGAVSEAARGVRRELEHLHSASPLQIFCGVELGREIYCEVAKLVGRCKCRVSHLIIGSVSFTEYSYLSTWFRQILHNSST